eukprot:c20186_g1_i2.p1 GENE.c20186_g1_i2~~c20186_g1_i2.p1  ORF type:complete len:928 (+),score=145.97 c20186_g1_i2:53-2785(+)
MGVSTPNQSQIVSALVALQEILATTTDPAIQKHAIETSLIPLLQLPNCDQALTLAEISKALVETLTALTAESVGEVAHAALRALLVIASCHPKAKSDLLDTPSLAPSLCNIISSKGHLGRDLAFLILCNLSNMPEGSARLVTNSDLPEIVTKISVCPDEPESIRGNALNILGNIIHRLSEYDPNLLDSERLKVRAQIEPLTLLPGFVGLRAFMIVPLLVHAEAPTAAANYDLYSDNLLNQLLDLLENTLNGAGEMFGFRWDTSESLVLILRLVQHCSPKILLKLATPRLTQLTVSALEKSPDEWTVSMGLELLEALCAFHREAHTTHNTTTPCPDCPLCVEPDKICVPMQVHLKPPTSLEVTLMRVVVCAQRRQRRPNMIAAQRVMAMTTRLPTSEGSSLVNAALALGSDLVAHLARGILRNQARAATAITQFGAAARLEEAAQLLENNFPKSESPADPAEAVCANPPKILGVNLKCFQFVMQKIVALEGNEGFTTVAVNDYLKQETESAKCTYIDHILRQNPERSSWIKKATHFLSHTWGGRFCDLVKALESWSASKAEECFFWFDVFVVPQHTPTVIDKKDFAWWKNSFQHCIKTIRNTVAFLDPWHAPAAATRCWCVWEWHCTVSGGGKFDFLVKPSDNMAFMSALVEDHYWIDDHLEISIEKAKCAVPQDLEMIMRAVNACGGPARINGTVVDLLHDWFRGVIDQKLSEADQLTDPDQISKLFLAAGQQFFDQDLHERAIAVLDRGLSLITPGSEPGVTLAVIRLQICKASALIQKLSHPAALSDVACQLQEILARIRTIVDHDPELQAHCLYELGCVAAKQREYHNALQYLTEATLALNKPTSRLQARILTQLGNTILVLGFSDGREAKSLFARALQIEPSIPQKAVITQQIAVSLASGRVTSRD